MSRLAKDIRFSRALLLRCGILCAFLAPFFCTPAHADDTPFSLEGTSWMSFNRYRHEPSAWQEQQQKEEEEKAAAVNAPPMTVPVIVPTPVALPVLTRPVDAPLP